MNLFKEYLVFQTEERSMRNYTIRAFSLDEIKDFKTPTLISPRLIWSSQLTLGVFKENLMLFRKGTTGFTCRTLDIEKGKITLSRHTVEKNGVIQHAPAENPTFYRTDDHAFFLFTSTAKDYKVRAVSNQAPISYATSLPLEGFGKLIQVGKTVMLCSTSPETPLKFQTLEVIKDEVKITPLMIEGVENYKFDRITCTYAHLDKLFLIGSMDRCPNSHLIIVNMKTYRIEEEHQLNLDEHPQMLAPRPGILCISNPHLQTIIEIRY